MKRQLLLLTLAGCNVALAQNVGGNQNDKAKQLQLNTITTAVPMAIITPDPRAAAIGDAGGAISPDAASFHWNTAKLGFSKEKSAFTVAYSPWLRQLVDDIHLSYLAGYTKLGQDKRHAVGGSLRYFSLGNITFTDNIGNVIREFSPNEFELVGGYSFRLSDRNALGINGKFIYSNLTGGINIGASNSKPGLAGAVDVSFAHFNEDVKIGDMDAVWSFTTTISNIGNKISYTNDADRDFLPTNLRLGTALKLEFDKYNSMMGTINVNKLLVPTQPAYDGDGNVMSGKDPDVGVTMGIIQSFYDAPGHIDVNANGDTVFTGKALEEWREYNFCGGIEYWYSDILAVRAGYFHEHITKGDRKYLTFGAGIYYSVIGIDVSYLAAFKRQNPLANTVRFSLTFKFNGGKKGQKDPSIE
jgi:hypothetical protein